MDAWVIARFGGPETFRRTRIPVPEPKPHEVLIAVRASSVNPVDYKIRDGRASFLVPRLPAILHADCAGVVTRVGADVKDFAEGDAVYSFATGIGGVPGALADMMAADASMVARMPKNISFEEAAALPLVAVTAWFSLIEQAGVGPGHRVMIEGGTGGVGHLAVQLARWRGARVYAMCGSPDKCKTVEALGAQRAYDYRHTVPDTIRDEATDGDGFDVVYNTPGAPSVDHAVTLATFGGTILDILGAFPAQPGFQMKWLTFRSVFAGRPILTGENTKVVGRILSEIATLVEARQLTPLLDDRRFTFETVGEAHAHAEHCRPVGKVVLSHPAYGP